MENQNNSIETNDTLAGNLKDVQQEEAYVQKEIPMTDTTSSVESNNTKEEIKENTIQHYENNLSDTTYHYGRNENPFSTETIVQGQDVSKNVIPPQGTPYMNSEYSQNAYANYQQNVYMEKPKKEKKKKKNTNGNAKKVGVFVGKAAAFGLIAGGVIFGVNVLGNKLIGKHSEPVAPIATVTTTDAGMQNSKNPSNGSGYADVAEAVMPSIVSITNTSVQTVRSWFQSYEREVSGSGSGIIIGQTEDAILIATNNHVIEGAKEITVAFDDKTAAPATVKGADTVADLAVVAVEVADLEKDTLKNIKVAALGSSDDLRVGEEVIAIGNALGYGQSLTAGYISALDREVDVEDNSMHLLQTDAAINPGNSGGALLNAKGEVIGINTMKYVDSTVEGMGYAIPISTAIPIVNDLMNQEVIEESEQGYLGIQGNAITDEYAASFNMPNGVYVVKIVEDSPADNCGLKAGDIITKFAGRDVNSMEALQNILTGKKAGEEVEMIVSRNTEKGEYEEVHLTVVLGAKKDMPEHSKEDATEKEETERQQESERQEITPEEFFEEFGNFFGN